MIEKNKQGDAKEFYNKQIEITLNLIQKINKEEPYSNIKIEILKNRLTAYKEELQRLEPNNLNNYLK